MIGPSIVAYSAKKQNFWCATRANFVIFGVFKVANIVKIVKFSARYARKICYIRAFKVANFVKIAKVWAR